MKWMRSLVPTGLHLLGVATATSVAMALAAQNEDEAKPAQSKSPAASTQKPAPATADKPNPADSKQAASDADKSPADRTQQDPNRTDRTPSENQRAAALGAQFEAKGDQGLSVANVQQNGLLSQAGLRQNDRIISADGRAFTNPRQLEAYLWAQSGRQVPIIVERGNQRYTVQANIPMHGTNSGWLGVFLDEGDANDKGARVTQVYPSGPAARAGIQVGDVIKLIDTQQIAGSADAVMLIRELQPKAEVLFTVERGKEELKIPVTIGSRGNFNYQSFYAGSQQDPNQGPQGQQFNGNDPRNGDFNQFNGVPPHAMQLENDRRNAEQHQRIEDEIRALRDEIKQLRELLEKK